MDVVIAYIIDIFLGDPKGYPHPVKLIGKMISYFEDKLRKIIKNNNDETIAGYFLCGMTVLITFIISKSFLYISRIINPFVEYVVNIILIYTCIATNDLAKSANAVLKALKEGDVDSARSKLSYIVSRDTGNLCQSEIARGTVETVAENISDGIIAPMFYAFIGGASLALAYKSASTLDSMVGYKNDKYINIGYASAKLDDILNFIPSRITGILIVIASLFLGYDYKNSFMIFRRDRLKHESPNSAHGEAALAGALDIRLGGLNYYFGKPESKPYLGDGEKDITFENIDDSIRLMYASSAFGLVIFFIIKTILWRYI